MNIGNYFYSGLSNFVEAIGCNEASCGTMIKVAGFVLGCYGIYRWWTQENYLNTLIGKQLTIPTLGKRLREQNYKHLFFAPEGTNPVATWKQVDMYLKYPSKFDRAVTELAKFALEKRICTVLQEDEDTTLPQAYRFFQMGKYRKFYLALDQGSGKIGIVGEKIFPKTNGNRSVASDSSYLTKKVQELLLFFPKHKKTILEVASKLYPSTTSSPKEIEQVVQKQLKQLESCVTICKELEMQN